MVVTVNTVVKPHEASELILHNKAQDSGAQATSVTKCLDIVVCASTSIQATLQQALNPET